MYTTWELNDTSIEVLRTLCQVKAFANFYLSLYTVLSESIYILFQSLYTFLLEFIYPSVGIYVHFCQSSCKKTYVHFCQSLSTLLLESMYTSVGGYVHYVETIKWSACTRGPTLVFKQLASNI